MNDPCKRRPRSYWTTCKCSQCSDERRRKRKIYDLAAPYRVPNETAWERLASKIDGGWTALALASATDLPEHYFSSLLADYRRGRRRHLGPILAQRIMNMGAPTAGSVGAEPARRRLRALARMGYSLDRLAEETGIGASTLGMVRINNERITARRDAAIRATYEQLAHTPGPDRRAAETATRKGWPSPLAWDDIDTDAEPNLGEFAHTYATARNDKSPEAWTEARANRLEDVEFLAASGVAAEEIARRLGVSLSGLEAFLNDQGRGDLYRRLRPRDPNNDRNGNWETAQRPAKGAAA